MVDFLFCRVVEILEFLGLMLKGFDLGLQLVYFRQEISSLHLGLLCDIGLVFQRDIVLILLGFLQEEGLIVLEIDNLLFPDFEFLGKCVLVGGSFLERRFEVGQLTELIVSLLQLLLKSGYYGVFIVHHFLELGSFDMSQGEVDELRVEFTVRNTEGLVLVAFFVVLDFKGFELEEEGSHSGFIAGELRGEERVPLGAELGF